MESSPKIQLFQDVERLIATLSENEINGFRPWRYDGYKWISFSNYFQFGNPRSGTSFQNNLAYYVSSDMAQYAQEVKLVLNINNPDEGKEAIDTFIRVSLKTFSALGLPSPKNLLTYILKGEEFKHEVEACFVSLQILKTTIYSWSLIVRSK